MEAGVSKVGYRRLRIFLPAALFVMVLWRPGVGEIGASFPVPQAAAPAAQTPLRYEVSVTLKLIQVFVTDAAGKPALGLEKSDFALSDNGRPQTITDFEAHVLAPPPAPRFEAAPPADIGVAAAPVPAPTLDTEVKPPLLARKFILLIDYTRNVPEGLKKAKQAALEFLETKVAPDDEVGLFTLSPISSLTLCENLTKDHAKIQSKLKKLHEPVGGGVDVASELSGMELMNAQVLAVHGGHAGPTTRNLFSDIAEWAKALRAIPGQKNIIWFTMGYGTGAVRPGSLNNVLFEAMAKALASANAPVFTVDTAPQAMPGREVWDKLPSGTLPERSLAYLSEKTGGKFLGDVNHSRRIAAEIHDATANYYVLGYYVPAAWDGKYHEVEVKVRRPGLVAHAQRGYFNPLRFAKLSPIEKHIRLIEAALGEASSGARTMNLPMTALPFAAFTADGPADVLLLAEVAVPSVRNAIGDRTEFITLVLDESGAIVDGKRAEVDWGEFRSGRVFQYGTAALPPGLYDCRAVIRNLDDGRTAVGACTVEVAAPSGQGPALFPPLLLVKGGDAPYFNLASAKRGPGSEEFSISRIFPFPAKSYVPLVGPLDPGAGELWAMLKCVWRGVSSEEIELVCSLRVAAGGEAIPVPAEIVGASSQDDGVLYLLRLELPALETGGYELTIQALDADGANVARTKSRIEVGPD